MTFSLQTTCDSLLDYHRHQVISNLTDNILTLRKFNSLCEKLFGLNKSDASLVLGMLERRGDVLVSQLPNSSEQVSVFFLLSIKMYIF